MRHRALIALLLFGLLLGSARADDDAGGWPFGVEGGGMRWGRAKDLYNLGILGAKARDPEAKAAPSQTMPNGSRRISGGRAPADDDGPGRLVVDLLFPRGPAERAGLRAGDEILAVSGRPIADGAFEPFARALLRAESGKGKLSLVVRREGEKGTTKVEAEVETGGRAAAKPTVGEGRAQILAAALDWLAERQLDSGGYPQTLSGANGAVVTTALAGLAWLGGGSDTSSGPHAKNVAKAVDFIAENVGKRLGIPGLPGGGEGRISGLRGLDQTNWGFAHAAIFLGELMARDPSGRVRILLERCGKVLAERQEASGGWAHGPGGPNPLGYTELNIVSGLALCGMGLARYSGWEPPEDVLEKAEAYLRASSAGDGGIGYSSEPGQAGMGNIGRTSACWLGYRTLGRGRTPWGQKMGKWVHTHAGDMRGAHASLMQHYLLAGVATHTAGRSAREAYWSVLERQLVLARAPDGSLQPRPWHESVAMGSNSDVSFGEVWTTAAWAVVLACEPERKGRPGLPAWMGEGPKKK